MFSKKFVCEIVQAGEVPTFKKSNTVSYCNPVTAGDQIYNPQLNDTQVVMSVEHWPQLSVVYVAPYNTPTYMANIFIKVEVDKELDNDYFGWKVWLVNGSGSDITVKSIGLYGETTIIAGPHKVAADNIVKLPSPLPAGKTACWKYSYKFGQAGNPTRYHIRPTNIEVFKPDGSPVGAHLIDITPSKG